MESWRGLGTTSDGFAAMRGPQTALAPASTGVSWGFLPCADVAPLGLQASRVSLQLAKARKHAAEFRGESLPLRDATDHLGVCLQQGRLAWPRRRRAVAVAVAVAEELLRKAGSWEALEAAPSSQGIPPSKGFLGGRQ